MSVHFPFTNYQTPVHTPVSSNPTMASPWSRGSHPWYAKRAAEPAEVSPPPPLGGLIRTLRVEVVEDKARTLQNQAKIRDPRTVNSFNWVDKRGSGPTILIPGKPPQWTPQAYPSRLSEDSGQYFRDKNAARYPAHPSEPAVVAALAADPAIPSKVDIFACGSTLGNLLRVVRGQDRAFRMLVYKLHKAVFLVRRENSPTELIQGVRGYGHAFPEANTTWEADVKGSASHQRLVRYDFGGLDLVVRFEADGYIKPSAQSTEERSPTYEVRASPSSVSSQTILNDLTTSLSSSTITPSLLCNTTPTSSTTTLTTTHTPNPLTPLTTLFDLKTRSFRTRHLRPDPLSDELPRLWASQIPHFILAFHDAGHFAPHDTEVRDVREDVRRWEREHALELGRLAAVLSWVKTEVYGIIEGGVTLRREISA
ncbi:hypothetical protein N658DRAFT_562034 [Parathielavia hyrcaniae]|uniref:Geranylgeranyl pyrophosphate synthetase n=1 Tax=Parathielavia hyrcaniae TaxID=113614 RepID=A0AAN6SXW8_9PEZI|nr:hypothetical protein N658DRAFT_562034 [Parathielavia hyrcaniae]